MEGDVENIHKFLEIPLDGEVRSALLDLGKPVPSVISNIFSVLKILKQILLFLIFLEFLFTKTTSPVIYPTHCFRKFR